MYEIETTPTSNDKTKYRTVYLHYRKIQKSPLKLYWNNIIHNKIESSLICFLYRYLASFLVLGSLVSIVVVDVSIGVNNFPVPRLFEGKQGNVLLLLPANLLENVGHAVEEGGMHFEPKVVVLVQSTPVLWDGMVATQQQHTCETTAVGNETTPITTTTVGRSTPTQKTGPDRKRQTHVPGVQ